LACHLRVAPAGTPEDAAAGAEEILKVAGPKSVRIFIHAIADASYGCFVTSPRWNKLHPKQFAKTFEVMAHSFVYWVQELKARDLLADGAVIVGLSNPMADSVVHGWGLVAAAKAALERYVRQIADELGPEGYVVTLVKFGLVETRAIRLAFKEEHWEALKKAVSRRTPVRRLCTVGEVARFLSCLAARQEASWFNGATVDFSGGQAGSLFDPLFNPIDYR
jgi:NAD(P)-dependent dehydrogenase (short-subunit alcohol dehydrogenase family)